MKKWFIQTAALSVSLGLTAATKTPAPECEPGYAVTASQLPAIYNQSARYDVCGNWDFFLGASFIYWQASQDGMDIVFTADDGSHLPLNGSMIVQNFNYDPGFKLTAGINTLYDHWSVYAQYTWYRGHSTMSVSAPSDQSLFFQTWQFFVFFTNDSGPSISSDWRVGIDLIDVNVSRPFYQGAKWTVTPYFGVRTALIRQAFRLAQQVDANVAIATNPVVSHIRSNSWGLGPRGGLSCNWLLGCGFSLLGDASTSLLFTRYTKIAAQVDQADAIATPIHVQTQDVDTLRPNATGVLGLNWGSYFDKQCYHFALAASYEFTVFWNQNMMRQFVDSYNIGMGASAGDLFLHGFTASAQFDF